MEPPPPVPAPTVVAGTRAKQTGDDGNRSPAREGSTAAVSPQLGKEQQSALDATKDGSTSLPPPPPKTADSLIGGRLKAVASGGYKPPSWGLTEPPGASGLSLTVLKGGVEVCSISLDNRTHVLLGELGLLHVACVSLKVIMCCAYWCTCTVCVTFTGVYWIMMPKVAGDTTPPNRFPKLA